MASRLWRNMNDGITLVKTTNHKLCAGTYCTDQSLAARHASHGPPPSLILAAVTSHRGVRRL